MDDNRSSYRDLFNFFVNLFIAMVTIGLAVYAIYIAGGIEAMTQPLPPIVLAAFGLAFIFVIWALINGLKMIRTPKGKSLEEFIETINQLKPSIDKAKTNQEDSKPKIDIELKINTADISKMKAEQLKAFVDSITELINLTRFNSKP